MTAASPTAACPSPRRRLALLLVCGLPGVGKSSFVRGLLAALAPPPDARQSERALECFSIEYDAAFARHAAPVADEDGISASASCDGGRPELSDHDIAAASAQRWHATRRHVFTECLRLLNDDGGGDSEGKSGDDLRAIPPPRRSDRLIVLDDNFYFASMRRPFYQLAQAVGAAYNVVLVSCRHETADARNRSRDARVRVTDETMERMRARFEPPTGISIAEDGLAVRRQFITTASSASPALGATAEKGPSVSKVTTTADAAASSSKACTAVAPSNLSSSTAHPLASTAADEAGGASVAVFGFRSWEAQQCVLITADAAESAEETPPPPASSFSSAPLSTAAGEILLSSQAVPIPAAASKACLQDLVSAIQSPSLSSPSPTAVSFWTPVSLAFLESDASDGGGSGSGSSAATSLLHRADLILRACVGGAIREQQRADESASKVPSSTAEMGNISSAICSTKDVAAFAKKANEARKRALADMRVLVAIGAFAPVANAAVAVPPNSGAGAPAAAIDSAAAATAHSPEAASSHSALKETVENLFARYMA